MSGVAVSYRDALRQRVGVQKGRTCLNIPDPTTHVIRDKVVIGPSSPNLGSHKLLPTLGRRSRLVMSSVWQHPTGTDSQGCFGS